MSDSWLPTLMTETPQAGCKLVIKPSRMAIKLTQPDEGTHKHLREDHANNADSLTMVSEVVARNFQTVAAANNYWRDAQST